jgi:hypothetical protein
MNESKHREMVPVTVQLTVLYRSHVFVKPRHSPEQPTVPIVPIVHNSSQSCNRWPRRHFRLSRLIPSPTICRCSPGIAYRVACRLQPTPKHDQPRRTRELKGHPLSLASHL